MFWDYLVACKISIYVAFIKEYLVQNLLKNTILQIHVKIHMRKEFGMEVTKYLLNRQRLTPKLTPKPVSNCAINMMTVSSGAIAQYMDHVTCTPP